MATKFLDKAADRNEIDKQISQSIRDASGTAATEDEDDYFYIVIGCLIAFGIFILYRERDPINGMISAMSLIMVKNMIDAEMRQPSAPPQPISTSTPSINLHLGDVRFASPAFRPATPFGTGSELTLDAVSVCRSVCWSKQTDSPIDG